MLAHALPVAYKLKEKEVFNAIKVLFSAIVVAVLSLPVWAVPADKVGDSLCKRNPSCKVVKPENKTPEQVATEVNTARLKALGR